VNCSELRSESSDIVAEEAVKGVFEAVKASASCKASLSLKESFV
jgi:hypothetical protein